MKGAPYIPRVHGHEISLLVEIIDDANSKDLYTNRNEIKKKKSNK